METRVLIHEAIADPPDPLLKSLQGGTVPSYRFGGSDTFYRVEYTVSGSELTVIFSYLEGHPTSTYRISSDVNQITDTSDNEVFNLAAQ